VGGGNAEKAEVSHATIAEGSDVGPEGVAAIECNTEEAVGVCVGERGAIEG